MKTQRQTRNRSSLAGGFLLLATFVVASAILSTESHAAVIYRQNFGYLGTNPGTGERTTLSNVGWNGLSSASVGGNVNTSPAYYVRNSNYTGRPTNLSNVNAPVSASDQYGLVQIFRADNQALESLIYTDQYSIDRTDFEIDTISWYAAGTSGGANQESLRGALQIGGSWYVSQQMFAIALAGNNPANFGTSAGLVSLNMDTATWYTLTASVGSPFAIGSVATALPTGDVSAFGLFGVPRQVNGSYLMFDSFTIDATAVPEPSGILLVGVALALGFILTPRTRNGKLKAGV